MHETILEDGLGYDGRSFGKRHQRHVLRLHVGREARMRERSDIRRIQPVSRAHVKRKCVRLLDANARLAQLVEHGCEVLRVAVDYIELTARDGGCCDESARFDAVGYDRVLSAAQMLHAFYADGAFTSALYSRAHLVEQLCKVNHLRLARGVV